MVDNLFHLSLIFINFLLLKTIGCASCTYIGVECKWLGKIEEFQHKGH